MSFLYGRLTSDAIRVPRTCRVHRFVEAQLTGWTRGVVARLERTAEDGIQFRFWVTAGSQSGNDHQLSPVIRVDIFNPNIHSLSCATGSVLSVLEETP